MDSGAVDSGAAEGSHEGPVSWERIRAKSGLRNDFRAHFSAATASPLG